MRSFVGAGIGFIISVLFGSTFAFAQSVNVMANQFAGEAGTIAGVTQACGTNITEYNSRALEAINALAKNPGDRQQALTIYMDALSKAQDAQTKNRVMNCSKVMQDFNSLPLMKPDYKTVVLPQLANMTNPQANTTPPTTDTTTTGKKS
jgi:hypothetical protein